jgi:hypothetical protein
MQLRIKAHFHTASLTTYISKNYALFFFLSDWPESFGLQIQGTALVLDEIINHVQTLQRQVEVGLLALSFVVVYLKVLNWNTKLHNVW